MKKMKPYKGYTATVEFDPDEMVLHGRLDYIRDVVTFHASSVVELQQEFETAVDDYLDFCTERGEQPEKPFSGRFVLRVDPDLHRRIALAADREHTSINTWIVEAISSALADRAGQSEQEHRLFEQVISAMHSTFRESRYAKGGVPHTTYVVPDAPRSVTGSHPELQEVLRWSLSSGFQARSRKDSV